MKTHKIFSLILTLLPLCSLHAQTIAEKKAIIEKGGLYLDQNLSEGLQEVNGTLFDLKEYLRELYSDATILYQQGADHEAYAALLEKINSTKEQIAEVQTLWKNEISTSPKQEQYGLMHAPDVLLSELIMDYGSSDFVYIIPPEIESMHLHITSNMPIPKESWQECLESILDQYGIAMRSVNPFVKELYCTTHNFHGLATITDSMEQLALMPSNARICFIMSEEESDPRGSLLFLRKFSNPQTTSIQLFGGRVFILSTVSNIQELFKLYGFVKNKTGKQEIQLITLNKIDATEMSSILQIAFNEGPFAADESNIRIMPLHSLPHSLVLAGNKEEIKRAKSIIEDIESNLKNSDENTLFWYTVKHSDAEELSATLAKVYDLMINTPSVFKDGKIDVKIAQPKETTAKEDKSPPLAIAPQKIAPAKPLSSSHKPAEKNSNFIVDPKTSSIMIVVKREILPHIKQLLKKLDVPKKMVQIEVLLFEKKMENQSKCGLNLLKLGSQAAQTAATGLSFQTGILEFFISHNKGSGIPAYDLAYNFLLAQEDVQINASPSVTTMNQTPATIAIVEEISIDAGADDKKNRVYNRAQYGITLQITPTINYDTDDDENPYITLETDITFDTTKNNKNDRPDVTRRHIENHVRIKDGETVILGGLRRKNQGDKKDSIPFLGEIPGFGKLFSSTEVNDSSTEMFIFITPKILFDPHEDAERVKIESLSKRAGDLPEFLQELDIAKDKQKKRLFESSMSSLFGRHHEAKAKERRGLVEYDGHE